MKNQYKNIPVILKQQPQWVVWGVLGEPIKVPFNPESLLKLKIEPAKSGIPKTWGTYESAERCVRQGLAQGIGYEFNGQGIYGIDLDHVINENGIITPQAKEIVAGLASYTEVSPSGHGLHIFVTADTANITRHRKQGGFVEIYTNARYFTVTGNVYENNLIIAERSVELEKVHDQYLLPEIPQKDASLYSVESLRNIPNYLERGLEKDPVLQACWNGERRCGDESASDQALMNKLAYWCNANHDVMMSAFLQSPYFFQKGEAHKKKCRRFDYLSNTIKTACDSLHSTAHEDTQRYKQKKSRDVR